MKGGRLVFFLVVFEAELGGFVLEGEMRVGGR